MAFSTRTVTHAFTNADGTPASGSVTFALSRRMTNSGTTVMPSEVVGSLNASGQLSVVLTANDDPGTVPTDAQWNVTFRILGTAVEQFFIVVPTGTGTVDLGTLLPGTPQVA
ncbi:MAG TPA: hypothetical protein VFH54_17450 [Mycobacteriales bacterium]|nr:hypothetical protein [Mycobacteriales bacterium]